jgi:short-subunit dehydrogenase
MSADVTDDESIHAVVGQVVDQFGGIDVWVNNVGKSTRADVMQTGVAEYRAFMELNFLSAVRCWNACKHELTKSSGILVNIGSLASKTGWPLMSPYSASKHALSAFSQQLRLEGPSNVNVLHVCPGPIKREGNDDRYASESAGLGERAKMAGAGAAIKGIEPAVIAAKIIRGCEKRKGELVIPWSARMLFAISQLSSTVGDGLLKRFIKK